MHSEEGQGVDKDGFPTLRLGLGIKNTGQLVQSTSGKSGARARKKKWYNLVIVLVSTKNNRLIDRRTIK